MEQYYCDAQRFSRKQTMEVDLFVGVNGSALNFLNSASACATRYKLLQCGETSLGILLSATFSSGVEVARSGISILR